MLSRRSAFDCARGLQVRVDDRVVDAAPVLAVGPRAGLHHHGDELEHRQERSRPSRRWPPWPRAPWSPSGSCPAARRAPARPGCRRTPRGGNPERASDRRAGAPWAAREAPGAAAFRVLAALSPPSLAALAVTELTGGRAAMQAVSAVANATTARSPDRIGPSLGGRAIASQAVARGADADTCIMPSNHTTRPARELHISCGPSSSNLAGRRDEVGGAPLTWPCGEHVRLAP